MTSKHLRRQLIAAVVTFLVAAFAITASTFAWFAANTQVLAQGMTVSAQADTMFLQIKGTGGTVETGTVAADGNDFATSGAVVMTDVAVLPTAHGVLADNAAVSTAANWYYRYSDKTDDGASNLTAQETVNGAHFNKYVAAVTYQVRIKDGTNITEVYDLFVKKVTLPADTGIRAIVAGQDRFQEFTATVADNESTAVVLSDTVTTTPQTVTVYLYVDGNDDVVYTDNIAQLLGDIEIKFSGFEEDTL